MGSNHLDPRKADVVTYARMKQASIDIIVPVRNEAGGLARFHDRIRRLPLDVNLVFVDNASEDDSVRIIETFPETMLIRHSRNEGYGGSILDGIRRTAAPHIVIIDADCEYPPECIPELVRELDRHPIVCASRLLHKRTPAAANMPFLKMFGNKALSSLFNLLFRQHTTDLYTGCKALRRDCLDGLGLRCSGFEHVLELAAKLAARGHKIAEIPVDFSPRETGRSKMKHVSETLKFMGLLMVFFLRSKLGRL